MIKFDVMNRWRNRVQFTAEIDCLPDTSSCSQLGLAVLWAIQHDADLSNTDLNGADLSNTDLSNADLNDANLSGANLNGANLSHADLSNADLSNANLNGVNLFGANLSGADLYGANLRGADLSCANLRRANLRGANLRSFKADLWITLTENKNEVSGLVAAMKAGRIDGAQYEGECACLVGTIAKVKKVSINTLPRNVSHPAEQWFLMVREGDKPTDDTAGGVALGKALEWTLEWCTLNGVEIQG